MKVRYRATIRGNGTRLVALFVALACACAAFLVAGFAHAATPPTFEPDPQSVGAVSLYNAAGSQITSGSVTDSPLAAYYAGSGGGIVAGDNKANIVYATPQDGVATASWTTTETWTSTQLFGSTIVYPGSLAGTTHAVVKGASTDGAFSVHITDFPNASTLNPGIYQIRLYTTQAGGGGNDKYYSSDILVSGTTWTQVYPAPVAGPTATTTTLAVSPASPQVSGTSVTLTATVAPAAAGTVQFKDGASNVGSPVTVAAGTASTTTSTLTVGTHSLTALFTPTNPTAFAASTSAAKTYVITAPAATPTTTALGITPASPITVGTGSTLTATVAPSSAAGSVQFLDGATPIGAPVNVGAGTATETTTFTTNTHLVKAVFTPADTAAFSGSQSAVVTYVVNPVPATPTTTALGVSPSSPQTFGTTLAFTGTVTPTSAVGTVQFLDGTTVIGTGTVSSGTATATTSTLGAGTHPLTAQFVPTVPANFGTSQSTATSYVINQATPAATLTASPASPVDQGTSVVLTASVTPASLAGSVQFSDGPTALGSPVTVAAGSAQLTTAALTVGSHSLTAIFTPTSANYAIAPTNAVTYVINPPPPGSTTTVLGVSPAGPVAAGTTETITATVTPGAAAGTVQFLDGVTPIGAPVTVSGGAAQTTTTLAAGTHSLTAHFVSGNASFNDSTSAAVSYVVKPPATATTTALTVTPAGPVTFGTSVTLAAAVTPSSAAGTVQFLDGTTVLDTKSVSAGAASLTTVGLSGGQHTLSATFVPTDPLDFSGSTGTASLDVTAVDTTTALAVTPAGPVTAGAEVTLTATVTPATAVGGVTFRDGSTELGNATVTGGVAVLKTGALPVGTASLTASFAGTTAVDIAPSDSDPVTLEVIAPPTIDGVTLAGASVHAGGTVPQGATLTVHGAGFQPNETVTAAAHSVPTALGTADADANGAVVITVTLPVSLAPGAHTLSLGGALGTATFRFSIAAAPTSTPTPTDSGSTTAPGTGGGGSGVGGLAATGADVLGLIALGLILAGAGVTVLLVTRRRQGMHRA